MQRRDRLDALKASGHAAASALVHVLGGCGRDLM
jgi:hypothetical protein